MDGWMDGWMDEWMDGWMDRWMDDQMVKSAYALHDQYLPCNCDRCIKADR